MLSLLIVGLIAYRVTHLLTMEDGPFDLALRFRETIFRRFDENHWINKGLSCPLCVSFWLALPAAVLMTFDPPFIVALWLAGAGLACLMFQWEFKNS